MVKRAVDNAREDWIRRVGMDGEVFLTRPESRKLQQGHAGCK